MAIRDVRSRCSHPGCNGESTADLILKLRGRGADGRVLSTSSRLAKHLYLCDEHWPGVLDFMEAYEGESSDKDIDG